MRYRLDVLQLASRRRAPRDAPWPARCATMIADTSDTGSRADFRNSRAANAVEDGVLLLTSLGAPWLGRAVKPLDVGATKCDSRALLRSLGVGIQPDQEVAPISPRASARATHAVNLQKNVVLARKPSVEEFVETPESRSKKQEAENLAQLRQDIAAGRPPREVPSTTAAEHRRAAVAKEVEIATRRKQREERAAAAACVRRRAASDAWRLQQETQRKAEAELAAAQVRGPCFFHFECRPPRRAGSPCVCECGTAAGAPREGRARQTDLACS